MTSYVTNFLRGKRRKAESNSEDTTGASSSSQFPPRPPSSSGQSTSTSSAVVSHSSTASSMNFLTTSSATSPSTSRPSGRHNGTVSERVAGRLRSGGAGVPPEAFGGGFLGHRRQHSSPGHLQQFQQQLQSRQEEINARIASRRQPREIPYDPDARPPKFKSRSPFSQSKLHLQPKDFRLVIMENPIYVLYDSKTIVRIGDDGHDSDATQSDCKLFDQYRKRADSFKMTKMVFGSGSSSEAFRLHVWEEKKVLLVSKSFRMPKYRMPDDAIDRQLRAEKKAREEKIKKEKEAKEAAARLAAAELKRARDSGSTTRSGASYQAVLGPDGLPIEEPPAKKAATTPVEIPEEDDDDPIDDDRSPPAKRPKFIRVPEAPSSDSDSQSTVTSMDGWRTRTTNSIMTTPEGFNRVRHASWNYGADEDSESQLFGSAGSSMSLPRAFSPPHRIARNRRRQMAVTTSLSETSSTTQTPNGSIKGGRSRVCSISTIPDDDHPWPLVRWRTVAIGIVVPFKHRSFLFQHIPVIEAEMAVLEARIKKSASRKRVFMSYMYNSWGEMMEKMCQIYNAPRLELPYWLALNGKCQLDERTLAVEFCEHLAYLVRRYDRKETGFFLSNLVTALLMHHMSWVASVAAPPLASAADARRSQQNLFFGLGVKDDAPTIGYNALMAQYLEISGSCGNVRSAKVCILGDDVEIMAAILSTLSFFIRCSAVRHINSDENLEVPTEQPFSPCDATTGSPDATCQHQHVPIDNNGPSTSSASAPQPSTVIIDRFQLHPEETSSVKMMRKLRKNVLKGETEAAAAAAAAKTTSSTASESLEIAGETVLLTASDSASADSEIPVDSAMEIEDYAMISESTDMYTPGTENDRSLARSMFAGTLEDFCPHFVLSAVTKSEADMSEVYSKMFDEMKCNERPSRDLRPSTSNVIQHHSLSTSSQSTSSLYDSATPENFLIVADIDNATVKVLSSEGLDEVTSPSECVVGMLEQFVGIYGTMPSTAEFLVGILEDSLAHIVGKSLTLVELVRSDQSIFQRNPASIQLTPDRVRTIIGCDHSDLRLIVNVAAVYWPPVLQSVMG
ncbi:unnamed protein product [Caenorhabditis nigoni]